MLIKFAAIAVLGAPPVAVLLFEIVLNATSMFNHSNIRLSAAADRTLRQILVTPDMHRVHHSSEPDETDSNYGFNFPFWDRLLGTYVPQPKRGHEAIDIGLTAYRGAGPARLLWGLMLPFRRS
jgi:sterol desaturase/sphingolipid hydroxylase (fatty acid hydroxylase superfamily)